MPLIFFRPVARPQPARRRPGEPTKDWSLLYAEWAGQQADAPAFFPAAADAADAERGRMKTMNGMRLHFAAASLYCAPTNDPSVT